jgi:hypothetical protein
LPGGAKERRSDGIWQDGILCTHIRYDRTRYGFVRQAGDSRWQEPALHGAGQTIGH